MEPNRPRSATSATSRRAAADSVDSSPHPTAGASTAWAPLPEPPSDSERAVKLWDPGAWRPGHQVRLDLPRSARGSHGRRSNELLCKRADIPRDFVHLRARIGTPLAKPYSRPPTKDRPWAQNPPKVDQRAKAAKRRSGIQPGDRVRLKGGLKQLKNGGSLSKTSLIVEITGGKPGKVKATGPQYGGDVLVDWGGGKTLWYSPAELEMV